MHASIEDVDVILGTGPEVLSDEEQRLMRTFMESVDASSSPSRRVHGDRERLRKKAAARREMLRRLEDRDHCPRGGESVGGRLGCHGGRWMVVMRF